MKPALLKEGEMVVKKNDFGLLVESYVRKLLQYNPYVADGPDGTDSRLREWWPQLEEYYQRHIQSAIEVAIEMDKYPAPSHSDRKPLQNKELWLQFLKDFRPAKSEFTIDYHCNKCKTKNVKLWRGVHGCDDDEGNKLLCASCLAPGLKVNEKGKAENESIGFETDQIKDWLPAIPVDDTYWGYTSVPSQDVEWWVGLPTYPPK
jgi:hypothetical protein